MREALLMGRIWGGLQHKCLWQRKKDASHVSKHFTLILIGAWNCLSPDLFPPCHLNSFQTLTRHDCLNRTSPIVFFVSSHLSGLPKRWLETPHPLDNPCNNYFGISCFAMVTVTCSIAISITMALVPFNLISLLKGLMTIKPFLDHFLALGSSAFSPSLVLSISTLYTQQKVSSHLVTITLESPAMLQSLLHAQ